jgi:hypothetical protein
MSVWPVAIQTLTPLGTGSSPSQELKDPLQRLGVHIPVNPHATAAKFDLDYSGPCALRRGRTRQLRAACRRRRRGDLDRNKSRYGPAAKTALARLPTPGEQQAWS